MKVLLQVFSSIFFLFFSLIRSNLKQLLENLNNQKDVIKKHGIWVGGKKYNISFTDDFLLER